MGDQRWERDFEVAVDEIIDVEPPARARHVPDAPARRSRGTAWRPLGLLAAALLAAVFVLALTDFRPAPMAVPSATPPPAATPVVTPEPPASVSGIASLGPDWQQQLGMGAVIVPSELMRTMPVDAAPTPAPGRTDRGPFAYGTGGSDGTSIEIDDYGLGTTTYEHVPLGTGEQLLSVIGDSGWLAVLVSRTDRTCDQTTPWRLLAGRLGAEGLTVGGIKGLTEVASGEEPAFPVAGQDCKTSTWPLVALGGGHLAWAEDFVDGSWSRIRVVALDDMREFKFEASRHAVELAVSADAVAWVESSDPGAYRSQMSGQPSPVKNWRVMEGSLADGVVRDYNTGHEVDIGQASGPDHPNLPGLLLDGSAVVATRFEGDITSPAVQSSVVRAETGSLTVIDSGENGRKCQAVGAQDGLVSLYCVIEGIQRDTTENGHLTLGTLWTQADGLRVIGLDTELVPSGWIAYLTPGWLLLYGEGSRGAVPISAVSTY